VFILSHFEFDGEKYKQASKHQKEWGNKSISELNLRGDEKILDLGCGDGVLTEQLATLTPKGTVIGIDASVGMIETAKKLEKPGLTFACLDINEINFENQFDIIFSNAALHWIKEKDHQNLLKNSRKALKTGGIIKWNFAGDGNCLNFFSTIRAIMAEKQYKEYFDNFQWPWFIPTVEEYKVLIENAGFGKINIEIENADRYFPTEEEMIKWLDQPSLVPFIIHVPDEKKKEFRQRVIDTMMEKAKQPDGSCFETFRRINIKAEK